MQLKSHPYGRIEKNLALLMIYNNYVHIMQKVPQIRTFSKIAADHSNLTNKMISSDKRDVSPRVMQHRFCWFRFASFPNII